MAYFSAAPNTEVGAIVLTNATPLDAQNIFSRINSGGTALKAEELLSAKPYWNKKVIVDSSIEETVNKMYQLLGVKQAPDGIVRWDVAATLIERLKDYGLLFRHSLLINKDQTPDMDEVTLGFKLLSSVFKKGMSKIHVNALEEASDQNFQNAWDDALGTLVEDLNTVFKLISDSHPFFKFFADWRKPLQTLIPAAALLEFTTILYFYWQDLGRPHTGQGELEKFNEGVRILFDRVIFESMTGYWKGSGDSKMAKRLSDYVSFVKEAVPAKDWQDLVNGLCLSGEYQSVQSSKDSVKPLLYYCVALQNERPSPSSSNYSYEIDHLIPKAFLSNSASDINQQFCECLANFSLMPKDINNAKKARFLKEISDPWEKSEIARCSGVSERDFEKYSDINNVPELQRERTNYFLNIFGNHEGNFRQRFLSNPK